MKAVVLYLSRSGNTKAVAEYIAKRTKADIFDLSAGFPDISDYDTAVVGGAVYKGIVPKTVLDAADRSKGKRVFFFLCCKFDGEQGDEQFKRLTSHMKDVSKAYFPGEPSANQKEVDAFADRILSNAK